MLVNIKNDKLKFYIIPKKDEEYISVTYGCIRFFGSYRFLSNSLDELVKTLVDNSLKTLKNLKNEIVDNDNELLNIVNEIEKDRTIEDLKKDYPYKIEELEEDLLNYIGGNHLYFLKTEFPYNKWKYLTKILAYLIEYLKRRDEYQKRVDNLEKEGFFSKLEKNVLMITKWNEQRK